MDCGMQCALSFRLNTFIILEPKGPRLGALNKHTTKEVLVI